MARDFWFQALESQAVTLLCFVHCRPPESSRFHPRLGDSLETGTEKRGPFISRRTCILRAADQRGHVTPEQHVSACRCADQSQQAFRHVVLPGVRHSFQPVSGYVKWLRGDYFARHLLGSSSETTMGIPTYFPGHWHSPRRRSL